MSYLDYLKMNEPGKLSFDDLVVHFLGNFDSAYSADDFTSEFKPKLVEISQAPEKQLMKMMERTFPGEQTSSSLFKEDGTFYGVVDLDFIEGYFANLRIQLFGIGFFAPFKINRRYKRVLEFLTARFGVGQEEEEFNRLIWESERRLMITLRKVVGHPNISFTITDKQFA